MTAQASFKYFNKKALIKKPGRRREMAEKGYPVNAASLIR